ncbi:hypothetical protein DSL64_02940 [Dyadobacter luteus]|uniref:Peptidase S1 domain-containing protein n=1 Tax=Dyadobacter luteus TaxID=2259619 RepID=A0A3D8YGA5_9BACT|nr:trypsin-like serine protease [Dyadobacter luteus]REA63419.1 hypothetical protein DSL64_02940 [Dyadobacter luteus]
MSEELLYRPCVRVSIYVSGAKVSHGSGTLVKGACGFFVATAYHCVFGDEDQYAYLGIESIVVEQQKTFNSKFYPISVIEVSGKNRTQDWVILKVNYDEGQEGFPSILASFSFRKDTLVSFTGFQASNQDEARPFNCRVLNGISNSEFRITLSGDEKFKAGTDDARGLSGSGAFFVTNEKLYLIGILKSVKGDDALNDDIKCCPMTDMISIIGIKSHEISTETVGDDWASAQFDALNTTDHRDLIEKLKAVNSSISEIRVKRYCRDLALGKLELSNIFERDLSALKYRIFEACQKEMVEFFDDKEIAELSNDDIKKLIALFTNRAIEIIRVKSKTYRYPIIDDDLMEKLVLDLINDCYLSFDKAGIYE